MGFSRVEDGEPDGALMELGMSSLTAIELRARFSKRLGVNLPGTLVFDAPTPRALSLALLERVEAVLPPPAAGAPKKAEGSPLSVGPSAPSSTESSLGTALWDLVQQAHRVGALGGALQIIDGLARERRQQGPRADASEVPAGRPVRLASGSGRPKLLCIPALVVPTGSLQFARLARGFRGRREVWALPNPGFAPGEALPSSAEEALCRQMDAVEKVAGDDPYVLLGVSSGGWLAHAIVHALEQRGHRPRGLVLVDTYLAPQLHPRFGEALREAWVRRYPALPRFDSELLAMHAYFQLFEGWTPPPVTTPTLVLRPHEVLAESEGDDYPWRAQWELPHEEREVPGDHMSMVDDHAEEAAEAVEEWIRSRSSPRGEAAE